MGRDGTLGAIALGGGFSVPYPVPRRRRAARLGGLAGAVAALGCAAALIALPGSTAQLNARAGHGLASLPQAAQGPISAALGRDDPAYRVLGLRALNPAQHLRVGFSRVGVTVASRGARLGLTLSAYGYASALRALGSVAPQASANRVSYSHGAVREWFANGPLGLEQGFDLATRPNAGSGPLTFSLALSGSLAARLQGGSMLLGGRGVALRYTGLTATDARGRVLRSWLELAGGRLLIRVDDRGAVYPLWIDPFLQQAELTASGGEAEEESGDSVGVSGSTIVAGAPFHATGGNMEQGEAYVFTRPVSGWANATQTAELISEKGEPGERFGEAVAVSGNTIVVGAPNHKVGANEVGAAYVFVKPASGWAGSPKQSAELSAEKGQVEESFGKSVAVSGNTVAVGGPDHKATNKQQGAAYVFVAGAGGWEAKMNQTAELIASDGKEGDQLGESVAVSGDTVAAGAPHHEVAGHKEQGAAYVFSEPSGGWGSKKAGEVVNQAAELTASNGAELDVLGASVAVSGNVVVAGAPNHEVGSNVAQGAAYVFSEPGGGWGSEKEVTQAAELTASGGESTERLGSSIAISGQTVVAGAPLRAVGGRAKQGAAYVFVMPPSGWSGSLNQTAELLAEDGAEQDHLGESVAVSGDTVVAGAPEHKVGANQEQGAAYVFEEPPSVSISSPVNGATYTQGQVVAASYSCPTASGTTVTCSGPVANGAPIETSRPGSYTFTVSATDSDALGASQSVSYTVVAAPVSEVLMPAPIVSGLRETAKTWREGNALALISRKKPPVGTTFSFIVNEPASVTFTFTKPASGRRVGKSCVAEARRNEKRKRCTRTVIAGTLTFSAHAGTNRVHFEGRISKHRRLAPGSHTLLVIASVSGKLSATRTLHFTIAV